MANKIVISHDIDQKSIKLFESYSEYAKYRDYFYEEIKPEIDELDRKRRRSVEAARNRQYK